MNSALCTKRLAFSGVSRLPLPTAISAASLRDRDLGDTLELNTWFGRTP